MADQLDDYLEHENWRKAEVADFCRVGARTIENWMAREGLPHIKIRNVVLFKPSDVKDFLAAHHRKNGP
jgi:excisionase family DNA binding protein